MMRVLASVILILLMAGPSMAQFGRRQSSRESDELTNEYGALLENNIFLRDRGRRPSATTRPVAQPLTREQTLILTGIILEDGRFRAYFEDTRSDSIVRVAEGDPIANGQIGQILLDAVAYEMPEGVRWIDIGHDLTATLPAAPGSPSSGARPEGFGVDGSPTTGNADLPAATDDPALMSVEERLRQRARQLRNR